MRWRRIEQNLVVANSALICLQAAWRRATALAFGLRTAQLTPDAHTVGALLKLREDGQGFKGRLASSHLIS